MSLPLLQVEARFFSHPARGEVQCFPTRILQKTVRRSAANRGIIIELRILKQRKIPNTSRTSRELLSGNWQHWSTLRARPIASFFFFGQFAFKATFSSTVCAFIGRNSSAYEK